MTWTFEATLSTPAGTLNVLEGSFTWDRGWTPLGAGNFVVPLTEWDALGLDPLVRHPMTVMVRSINYQTAGKLGDPLTGYPILVDQEWPDVPYYPYGDEAPRSSRVGWKVLLRDVTVNRASQTVTIEVQTFELALTETVNNGDPWLPAAVSGGDYDAADVLQQMLRYVGIRVPVEVHASATIPASEMAPWEPGQDAWAWWDRVRTLGELGAYYSPNTGILTISSAVNFTGTVPDELLEHVEQYGSSNFDSATYADSLSVNWVWNVEGPDGPEERTQRDVAYASGLTDWRQARRHRDVERLGPPVPGYAQRAVDHMARFRVVHQVTVPMTPLLVASAPGSSWQSATFTFGSNPTVALTLLTS